jgi:hypothetical protein
MIGVILISTIRHGTTEILTIQPFASPFLIFLLDEFLHFEFDFSAWFRRYYTFNLANLVDFDQRISVIGDHTYLDAFGGSRGSANIIFFSNSLRNGLPSDHSPAEI